MLTGSHAVVTVGGKRVAASGWRMTTRVNRSLLTASGKRMAKKVAKRLRYYHNRRRWVTFGEIELQSMKIEARWMPYEDTMFVRDVMFDKIMQSFGVPASAFVGTQPAVNEVAGNG